MYYSHITKRISCVCAGGGYVIISHFCYLFNIAIVLQGNCLPSTGFDMLIIGCEIPSWFVAQKCVSWAKVPVPNYCPLDEWVGFGLCFHLVNYADLPELSVICLDLGVRCLSALGLYKCIWMSF